MRLVPIRTVDGVDMSSKLQPTKGGYSVTKSDIYSDSTIRSSETGILLPYLIRRDVRTIELEYVGTSAQIAAIENVFAPPGGSRIYTVEFLDNGSYTTGTFYPSDRSKPTEIIIGGVQRMRLTLSLVEV
jgi:hypothetical protein